MTAGGSAAVETLTPRSSSVSAARAAVSTEASGADASRTVLTVSTDREVALNPPQRREHRAHFRLLRTQGELAEPLARLNAGHIQPHRPPHVVFPPEQRFEWNRRRLLQPDEQHIPRGRAELRRERGRDDDAFGRRLAMELPEPFVDAVDEDAGRSSPRCFVGHEPARDDERRGCGSGAFRAEIVRQRLANKTARRDDRLGASQASDRDVAQAAAHGVADEQRAGEHRDSRRHAERHGEVRPPVIPGAAKDQAAVEVIATPTPSA